MELTEMPNYEDMIDFMRKDLESGMRYSKLEMQARKIVESRGRDFDKEFEEWRSKQRKS